MGWEYFAASSVKEALDVLHCYKGIARIIAGGTDLMLDLQEKKKKVQCLVGIGKVPELQEITFADNILNVGAGVIFTEITKKPIMPEKSCSSAHFVQYFSPLTRQQF